MMVIDKYSIRCYSYMVVAPAAKAFVNFHKNQQLPAIIEYIRDGGCYRAYFPDQKINATIMLSGESQCIEFLGQILLCVRGPS